MVPPPNCLLFLVRAANSLVGMNVVDVAATMRRRPIKPAENGKSADLMNAMHRIDNVRK